MFTSSALNNACGNCTETKISGNTPIPLLSSDTHTSLCKLLQTTAKYSAVKCCSEKTLLKSPPTIKYILRYIAVMNLYTNEITVTGAKYELLCITVHYKWIWFSTGPAMNLNYRSFFLSLCVQNKKSLPFTTTFWSLIGSNSLPGCNSQ